MFIFFFLKVLRPKIFSYIHIYTRKLNKKKKKKKNKLFRFGTEAGFFAFADSLHFDTSERGRARPTNEGLRPRVHTCVTHGHQPQPISCDLAGFLFRFDKLHARAKKTRQTRNFAQNLAI